LRFKNQLVYFEHKSNRIRQIECVRQIKKNVYGNWGAETNLLFNDLS